MNKADVSIVIPCYNDGKYIRESVESVVKYSGDLKLEVIIVNDGSTDDNTLSELNNIKQEYKVVLLNQPNKRMSAARNFGIQYSKAPFIVALDADDLLNADFIDPAYNILVKDETIGVVYGNCEYFGAKQGVQEMNFDKTAQWYKNTINITTLFRKKLWEDCRGFDEDMKDGYEDWELWINAMIRGWKFTKLDMTSFKYRIKNVSVNQVATSKHHDLLNYIHRKHIKAFLTSFIDLHRENNDIINNRKRLLNYLKNNILGRKN